MNHKLWISFSTFFHYLSNLCHVYGSRMPRIRWDSEILLFLFLYKVLLIVSHVDNIGSPLCRSAMVGRILLVDDDVAGCLIVQRMLRNLGLACDVVHDGSEAVEALAKQTYSTLILDSFMPLKNGWELACEVNNIPEMKRPVMIGMMSNNDAALKQLFESSGVNSIILKPFSSQELQRRLHETEIVIGG